MILSNVIAARVPMKLQRGATQPDPAFRFKQSDGTYLDLTTVHQVHLWFRNSAKVTSLQLSIGDGLRIEDVPETTDKSLLVLDPILIPPGTYSYDIKIFLTEDDFFFPVRGAAEVVEYISE